jgi:glycosyltransferase involved in cell wall biosynthesis
MITVALPTWNNKEIIFLAMEGLIRQKNSPKWELLILECISPNEVGGDYFKTYWDKLQKAGCVRMNYMYSRKRMPLNQKWIALAKASDPKSTVFCLQASDDYAHNERNLKAYEAIKAGADWYDCRKYWQYHIALEKMILYDNNQTDAKEPQEWKTGFNMAIRTDLVRAIESTKYVRKGVDFWLFETINKKTRFVDQELYNGLSTTGLNTISNKRYDYFLNPRYPFAASQVTPEDLKIPKSVLKQLYSLKDKAIIDREPEDNTPVFVEFTKKINGKLPGHKQWIPRHALSYFLLRDAINIVYHSNTQKDFEICM